MYGITEINFLYKEAVFVLEIVVNYHISIFSGNEKRCVVKSVCFVIIGGSLFS